MRNLTAIVIACLLAAALGAGAVWHFAQREKPLPDAPALVVKVPENTPSWIVNEPLITLELPIV